MSKLFTPTFRISIGLVGLTMSLILSAYALGFIPDERRVEIEARAKIAEALAVQLANSASRNNIISIRETIDSVVKRNKSILSIALRHSTGELQISAGDHNRYWVEPSDHRSTPTHVQVTLMNGSEPWGRIEFAFTPLDSSDQIAGVPKSFASFLAALAILCFIGYYFLLRRALREVEPGNVIPERVQSAFDTLAEGVLILDERSLILLANDSFARAVDKTPKSMFGSKITELDWQQQDSASLADTPWQIALRDQKQVTGVRMGYQSSMADFKIFMVNATCILDESGTVSGVIVTFDDVTALEQKNDDLILAVRNLQQSEEAISHQNRELQYLANHDPLTGCLNRRAFFAQFADRLENAKKSGLQFACLMVDLDHFKRINDDFGHGIGDDIISGMAETLRSNASEDDLVGRYGGEEFCIALSGRSKDESHWFADQIREQMIARSPGWLKADRCVTASIGIATLTNEPCTVKSLVNRADKALYEAKETGRNKVVFWTHTSEVETSSSLENADIKTEAFSKHQASAALAAQGLDHKIAAPAKEVISFSPANMQSLIDPLTNLPSLSLFKDRISQSIIHAERNNKKVAILEFSLDSFERLTTVLGDAASQELISSVSTRFSNTLRQAGTNSRFDGRNKIPTLTRLADDKFLIEIADLEDDNTISWIIRRLFDSLSNPFMIEGEEIYTTGNIGISLHPSDGSDVETLIRHANVAQQHAKELDGKNNFQFFSSAMNEYSRRQLKLDTGLRHSVENYEFSLFYQPIIDASSGRLKAMETLLRCNNPLFSDMPIGMVISIAEQSGLIIQIGEWVTHTAIKQAEKWIASGLELPSISVNLSAIQLANPEAIKRITQIILNMDLPPQKLQFEITETAILKDVEAAGTALMHLQQLGVMIALDDFGTGQSSLSYLRHFRPDVLKIDRCFIGEITTSHADETLVSAIVAMSQRMGIRVVAEGVETKKQLDKVRDMGCDEIQGFYISKPMPVDITTNWLRLTEHTDIIEATHLERAISAVA